jgi:hypothetical protein
MAVRKPEDTVAGGHHQEEGVSPSIAVGQPYSGALPAFGAAGAGHRSCAAGSADGCCTHRALAERGGDGGGDDCCVGREAEEVSRAAAGEPALADVPDAGQLGGCAVVDRLPSVSEEGRVEPGEVPK